MHFYEKREVAEEEESKRRKEDMISTFIRLKLNKEEHFYIINNSKIINQWRTLLREVKTKDLHFNIKLLIESFSEAMTKKSQQVKILMQVLISAV